MLLEAHYILHMSRQYFAYVMATPPPPPPSSPCYALSLNLRSILGELEKASMRAEDETIKTLLRQGEALVGVMALLAGEFATVGVYVDNFLEMVWTPRLLLFDILTLRV